MIRRKYAGWSLQDRDDLLQIVMIKYFAKFGRERLPDDDQGYPVVPVGWLKTVVGNAGTDLFRHARARPADPTDFQGAAAASLEALMAAAAPQSSLASGLAHQLDVQAVLKPALGQLAVAYPADVELIFWRYFEDRDVDEIAAKLGKSTDAVKKALQRAVTRLRNIATSEL
ncbi:RNA polymerase sigma factor [Microbacterium laevaniformans]|uniref:RNA polymerase sigma factor n=2 Tax=Microbacterium laevaniformans TaxID=36807 RepID=A0A150HIE5_9MICO|nr:RNA polymerase sigma factor [Microbacterium laevaniformans]